MGFLSSPSAPDYKGAAQQQGQDAREIATAATYADRPTQTTPWGAVNWGATGAIDPATGQPVTQWTQDTTLTPELQRALDAQIGMQTGRSELAQSLIGRTQQELDQPFNWAGMPLMAGAPNVPDFYGANLPGMSNIPDPNTNAFGGSPLARGGYGGLSEYGQTPGAHPGIESEYNPDFAKTYFDRQMSLLGPEQQRASESLSTQLRNQGLDPSAMASQTQTGMLRNQQGEDLNRLSADAVFRGLQEQQAQWGRDMGSQSQLYGQQMGSAQMQNALRGQQFGELTQLQGMYGQGVDSAFQRQMQTAGMGDAQRQQLLQEQLAVGGQQFGQQMEQASLQNRLRQQAISEEAQRRGMSINEMNALMTGQQVNMPQMPSFNQSTVPEATQFLNAAIGQGNFDAANYGSMMGLFGDVAGAWPTG